MGDTGAAERRDARDPADYSFKFDNAGRNDQVANSVSANGWASFERPLPEFLSAAVRRWPGLVIDIGCNTGFYTLLAASADVRNNVLAFEPVGEIRAIARRNAGLNGVSRRVSIRQEAISDRNGAARLYIPHDDHGLVETSASLDPHFKSSHLRHDTVTVKRLDHALLLSKYRWKQVSVIKIDVEGHEAATLKGAPWIIKLYRPVIFQEVLQGADFPWLNGFLKMNRYVPYRLKPERQAIRTVEIGFDPQAWNQALVPEEKAQTFEKLVAFI